MKTEEHNPTVSPHRAARLLGVCRETVYRWVERSALRTARRLPNGRIVVSLDEVMKFKRDGYHF